MATLPQLSALKARALKFLAEKWPAILAFIPSYGLLLYFNHVNYVSAFNTGVYTLLIGLLVWALHKCVRNNPRLCAGLAYGVFFLTPLLTLTGNIGVLTGFGGSSLSLPWLGVSFMSAALAVHVLTSRLSLGTLCLHIMQPLRWNSGPCALPDAPQQRAGTRARGRRVWLYLGWVVLGGFFYGVLAAALAPLLVLKESTDALDIFAFAVIFEFYVYFNFSGISFMVFGLLNLAGIRTIRNFNSPFAAKDIIDYWQRWHISLSRILKILFFQPIKARLGTSAAVLAVFVSSALWHGVAFNFVLWGLFHACGWLVTRTVARSLSGPNARYGRWLNGLTFPFIVLLGRLIFSESDSDMLLLKLRQLAQFAWSADAWLLHLTLDTKVSIMLALAGAYLAGEVLLPRHFGDYKILRNKWAMLILLGLCLALGQTGLGGVYGAR
jgi:hypothetical protein